MIELVVKEFFEKKLDLPVHMEFPEEAPARFVILRKADTARENRIDTSKIVADSYAESLYEAAVLNEQVKEALDALEQLPGICRSDRVTDYPFNDIQNKRYRYQAVQSITHY